ncbi:helix-turn-helix domain-containing protein [Azospirillum sp. sgz302134]
MERTQEFGRMLRALREQRNLTQEDLAELIDRSVQAISKMERGLTFPKLETLIRISKSLDVPLRELANIFDSNESSEPNRISLETSILEATRRLGMRDLHVILKIVKVFPAEDKTP